MNKIKLKELADQLYKEEKEIFLHPDNWINVPEKEKAQALFDFEIVWETMNTVDDLITTLEDIGYDYEDACARIIRTTIEA